MILYTIEKTAAPFNKRIKPVFSFFADFYVKVYVQVFDCNDSAQNAFANFSKVNCC